MINTSHKVGDWKMTNLGSEVTFLSGGTPKKDEDKYWDGVIPWVSSGEMCVDRIYSTGLNVTEDGAQHGTRKVPKNTPLVVVRGMSLAKEFRVSLTMREMTFNQDVKALIPSDKLNPIFLFYYLKSQSNPIRDSASEAAHGTKKLDMPVLEQWPLPLPPVEVQQKIVKILSAYDDLIENNKRRIALLEKMAEEIYREWFVRFRFPGYQTAEFEKGIPKGWESKKLPEVANVNYGFPFQSSRFNVNGIGKPIIRIRNIPKSSTIDYTDEVVDDKYLVNTGDIVVGMDGEFHINRWYGEEAYLVQRVCRIKAKNGLFEGYLGHAIKAPIKHYEAIILGATVGHLGAKHLNAIDILIPPDELKSHIKRFNELDEQIRNLELINRSAERIKNSLLPRLISGKLSVADLDIQFPPSMLDDEAA